MVPASETPAGSGASGAATPNDGTGMRVSRRLSGWLLVLGLALLFFVELGHLPLLDPDEGRYAEIPREMLASGDWIVPRLDGVLYFEKPPLYYWLNAISIEVGGMGEWSSRFWSALFGLAGTGLAFVLARSAGRGASGRAAALVLGTSPLYLVLARLNTIDMTLSFFISAALTCFWLAHDREPGPRARLLWYGGFAGAALAVLTKGLVGLLIPGAVAGLFILVTGQWAILRRVPWFRATALFLVLAVPWHLAVGARHPDFYWFYFVHEHFLRYATMTSHRWKPFWFFVPIVLGGMLPWSAQLAAAAKLGFRTRGQRSRRATAPLFLAIWAGFVLVFFSLSKSKLVPYVLPALLPLAVLVDLALVEARSARSRPHGWASWGGLAGSCLVGGIALLVSGAALGWIPRVAREAAVPVALVPLAIGTAFLAILAGISWAGWRTHRAYAASFAAAAGLLGCLLLATPVIGRQPSAKQLAAYLRPRLAAADELASFDAYPQSLPAYLGREITVVDYQGELEFGISHLSAAERARRFPSVDDFRRHWISARRVFLVTDPKGLGHLRAAGIDPGPVLAREGKLELYSNAESEP